MTPLAQDTRFLAAGPLPMIGGDLSLVRPLGRIGDALVYAVLLGERPARLQEYCPRGVAQRVADGTLHPTDARLLPPWEAGMAAFLDQGRLLTGFDHPGVAPVWRAVQLEQQGVPQGAYLVGAPVGETLGSALDAGLSLTPPDVVRFAAELADVLAALHARGVAHLAIAPETVSIATGRVQLSDFAVDNRPYMALLETQEGFVRPGYSPIEHYDASGADPLGPRADVYAASALLFRLVTGRDPAPWQERWRDPSASELAGRDAYPPAFITAIRQGMAIEPADRYADGGAWRAAMGGARPLRPVLGNPSPAVTVPMSARPGKWLWPLLLTLGLLIVAALGYIAYAQHWFIPARQETVATNMAGPVLPPIRTPVPLPDLPPQIRPGASVAGQLSTGDRRRPDGEYEDRFRLVGSAGERIELRVSATAFDPVVTMTGLGLDAANDDDPDSGRNSRLVVTLPRDGTYTIGVSSYDPGSTGGYLLEVVPAEAPAPAGDGEEVRTVDLSAAARLAGQWHAAEDPTCKDPASNSVSGSQLTSRIGGTSYTHRILEAGDGTVRTVVTDGPLAGHAFLFRLSPDADSYAVEGETWTRC